MIKINNISVNTVIKISTTTFLIKNVLLIDIIAIEQAERLLVSIKFVYLKCKGNRYYALVTQMLIDELSKQNFAKRSSSYYYSLYDQVLDRHFMVAFLS
jgi:hypothetical protein